MRRNNRRVMKRLPSRRNPKPRRNVLNATFNSKYIGHSVAEYKRMNPETLRIPRNTFAPPAIIVDFEYLDLRVDNNAGSTYTSYRFRMNSAYDPDPALGSGALPGFTEWAGIYRNYRVLTYEIETEVSNLESFPVTVVICPSQADLGLNYSATSTLCANPGAVSKQLSAKGGIDRSILRSVVDLGKYYGNEVQWLGNDSFGALISTNPATLFYMNVGAIASSNFVNGFTARTIHRYTVAMYGIGILGT